MADSTLRQRLRRLFSTSVIVRNIGGTKLKVADVSDIQRTSLGYINDRYMRLYGGMRPYMIDQGQTVFAQRLNLFKDYECLAGETIIPLPDGSKKRIDELAKMYPNKNTKFYVYSYDHQMNEVKLGLAHSVRKTKHEMTYKITFDNGEYIVATANHPFLMKTGEYKRVSNLEVGDSVMPFYQKDFYGERYRHIYNFSKGWVPEHRLVAEQFYRKLEKNQVVHHVDFNKENNLPENLLIMNDSDHKKFHCEIINKNIIWSPENYEKQCKAISEGLLKANLSWGGKRIGKNNPFYGKKHSEKSNQKRSITLKKWHKTQDFSKGKNPNFRQDILFENIFLLATNLYKETGQVKKYQILRQMNCDNSTIFNRLAEKNIYSWKNFENYVSNNLNHKIVSIEPYEEIDVYDMTVELYHNFATETCFVHNSMDQDPIISSALDIYADESTMKNELNQVVRIKSENNKVRGVLENLFNDILNIEFNLWPWVRNLTKYGDFFLQLEISEKYGITNILPLSPYEVTREEGYDKNNPQSYRFNIEGPYSGKLQLDPFQVAHFRLLSDSNYLPYGKCLTGDTHIDTEFGSKYISEINESDKVWILNTDNMEFELVSVLRKIYSGKKKILKIKTQHNFLKSSENHPILTYSNKNGKFEYKLASDINLGDLLVISSNKNKKSKTIKVNKELAIDNDNIIIEPVKGIEEIGDHDTWDIQVDSKYSNFVANGFVVHNSMIEGARRVWKQLSLMEDAMLLHRIMRAPEKRIFKIDIGNIPPDAVDAAMERIINQVKKVPYVDPNTGEYDLKFNLNNMIEDFYLPVRGGESGTTIDTLAGMQFNAVDDIEYLRNKMLAALKIPKAFLGYEEQVGCLVPETKIPLLNGKTKTMKELIEDYERGIKNYVYSIDENKNIVPGEISWAGYTRKNAKLVRVYLDNGKYIDSTPDHKYLTRNGEWIEAQNLKENVTLMPLYLSETTQKSKKGYTTVYQPSTEKYQEVHRLVAEYFNMVKAGSGKSVHHKDFNKKNNDPENLDCSMNYIDFIFNNMPLALNNKNFVQNYRKYEPKYANHIVTQIEFLEEQKDTCDITIEKYHNFATDAGVIVHNSKATLAAEDVRFARTIERIQKIVISELTKIAIIHLYVQGFEDADLVQFELELTNPSTIYEQEKLELWNTKIALARDAKDLKLLSSDWVYNHIFNMGEDEILDQRKKVTKDLKRSFRFNQIETEGNDPAESKQAFGGEGAAPGGAESVEQLPALGGENVNHNLEYDDLEETGYLPGTDKRRGQKIRTRRKEEPFGEDPIGQKDYEKILKVDQEINHKFKHGSPLARSVRKNVRDSLKKNLDRKKIISEVKNYFLDEENISNDDKIEKIDSTDI